MNLRGSQFDSLFCCFMSNAVAYKRTKSSKVAVLPPLKKKGKGEYMDEENKVIEEKSVEEVKPSNHKKLTSKVHEQNLKQLEKKRDQILHEREKYQKKINALDRQLEAHKKMIDTLKKRYEKLREKEQDILNLEDDYYNELEKIRSKKSGKKHESLNIEKENIDS